MTIVILFQATISLTSSVTPVYRTFEHDESTETDSSAIVDQYDATKDENPLLTKKRIRPFL